MLDRRKRPSLDLTCSARVAHKDKDPEHECGLADLLSRRPELNLGSFTGVVVLNAWKESV